MVWALGALASSPSALAQSAYTLSPLGTRSAINTPVADALPWGDAAISMVNSNPEIKNKSPGVGEFGSLAWGFGLLPGLEGAARLAYVGDLRCSQFSNDCKNTMRDLSVSGKYQLPLTLPMQTRLAAGFTDYGGAATNFRSRYVVATSTIGAFDLSLGYSDRDKAQALQSGAFGSAVWQATTQWQAQLEYDTRETRAGLAYALPLGASTTMVATVSRKLSANSEQQASQMGITLNFALDRKQTQLATVPYIAPYIAPDPPQTLSKPNSAGRLAPIKNAGENDSAPSTDISSNPAIHSDPVADRAPAARDLRTALEQAGFAIVAIDSQALRLPGESLRRLTVEPVAWRKNRLDALGHALGAWLASDAQTTHLLLTLSYQAQPVLHVYATRECLLRFRQGEDYCEGEPALALFTGHGVPKALAQLLQGPPTEPASASSGLHAWRAPTLVPQFEIGLGLRTAVGTEAGLLDYTTALELGGEITLAKGLGLQGYGTVPWARSKEYAPGGVFQDRRFDNPAVQQALLTYWQALALPLPGFSAAQVAAGQVNKGDEGGQVDLLWLSPQGRWRAQWQGGAYESTIYVQKRRPLWGALRYSVIPGHWQVELAAGQFYNLDQGWRLTSVHRLAGATLNLFLRETGQKNSEVLPIVRFAGFRINFPIGPDRSTDLGLFTLRGADNWNWGLETKVGETNNNITPGYGQTSTLRHGISVDVSDYDRGGVEDLWVRRGRVREGIR